MNIMSKKAQTIKSRYEKGYVTDSQLLRYLELEVITQEEYDTIYLIKHPNTHEENTPVEENITTE